MKNLLLNLLLFAALLGNAQQIDYTLGKCSNNADKAIKAFNIGNLKYYAKISKSSIEKTIAEQEFKDCYNAFDLSKSVLIHLDAAIQNDDFATAQSHMMKVKEIVLEIFNEYNLCSITDENTTTDSEISNPSDLGELELQKEKLRKQQELLKQQEEELLQKLEEKKQKSMLLEKQNFIDTNQSSLKQNIKSYNLSLNACNCDGNLYIENDSNLSEKTLDELRTFFIDEKVKLAQKYMLLLNSCKTK